MMRSRITRILVAVLSAGWLVPLWIGVDVFLSHQHAAAGVANNSFPVTAFTRQCLLVSFVWLAVVIVLWAYRSLSVTGRDATNPVEPGPLRGAA